LDWFVFFLGDIQTGFGPFLSIYLVTQKWTQTDIGLVLSVGALAGLFCQIPGGALIDAVRSERRVAAIAVAAIGISAAVIAAWPIFIAVAAARVLHAAASAVLGPAIAAISLGLVGRHVIAPRLGRNARFAAAGNGAAAVLMGAFGHYLSPQSVFIVTAAFAIPTLAALQRIRDEEISVASAHGAPPETPPAKAIAGVGALFRRRALWIFIFCVALFQLANTPMLPLVGSSLTMRSGDWAVALVAACIVVPQLFVAVSSPWVGRLAHTIGRRPLLLIGFAALPVRGLLFAYVGDPFAVVATQLLDGVSAAVLGVLLPLVLSDIAYGTGHFNLAQGIAGTAVGFAAALSTTAAGYVTDRFGSHTAFLGLAGTAGCGLVLLAALMPETRPPDE
jgi:MFS family permease